MKKLKLSKLKVTSFVTSLSDSEQVRIQGGEGSYSGCNDCFTGGCTPSFVSDCATAGACSTSDIYGTASPACQ